MFQKRCLTHERDINTLQFMAGIKRNALTSIMNLLLRFDLHSAYPTFNDGRYMSARDVAAYCPTVKSFH
jgi:hypothetical protein